MHDEAIAIEIIKNLPDDAKNHLSDIVRNHMVKILSAGRCPQVQRAVLEFEKDWGALGL